MAKSFVLVFLYLSFSVGKNLNDDLHWNVTNNDVNIERHSTRNEAGPQFWSESMNSCLEGKIMKTINGKTIYAYQGIKYGQAPIGDLRFKATKRHTYNGEEIKNGKCPDNLLVFNHIESMCVQTGMISKETEGDEDCLFLNVYSPKDPSKIAEKDRLPVMFWIHGGSFTSGDSSLYLPTKLLEHDVILVVIHYRLGSFGFYFLDNEFAPGNAALYDQIEALKWVHDHISDFGGDTNRITIFGESAGAVSVSYLMMLPQTEGLLHNVIAQSGSALENWALDPNPLEASFAIARKVGCLTENDVESPHDQDWMEYLGRCMQNIPYEKLHIALEELVMTDRKAGKMGFEGCAPVIQDPSKIDNPLITKDPKEMLIDAKDRASGVNLMIGANKDEGSYVLGVIYSSYLLENDLVFNEAFMKNEMIPTIINAFGIEDKTKSVAKALTEQYLPGIELGTFEVMADGLVDMVGALFLKAGGWETAKIHAEHYKGKTFFYSFEFESEDSMFLWLLGPESNYPFTAGVTHGDELLYLFSFPAVMDDEQKLIMDRMTKLWTNFATHGNPTPTAEIDSKLSDLNIPRWEELTSKQYSYMSMRSEFTIETDYSNRWVSRMARPPPPTFEEVESLTSERDAYMISLIVSLSITVLLIGIAAYAFYDRKIIKKNMVNDNSSEDKL